MEFGKKPKEMEMTTDEINWFTNAFKDPKFRETLDYAKELAGSENYEEEIKLLEQERGMVVLFIHPEPCRVLKTSADGKQKCFINICSSESIGKPEFKAGRSTGGSQYWSLPHTVTPGRPDRDGKGNKFMIYDVVFHPDTLYIAGKNWSFMDMVDGLALQAVQDGFKVKLDKKNTTVLKIKYKGTPQPSVTRKSIPGHPERKKAAHPDPFSFPYADDKRPDAAPKTGPNDNHTVKAKPSQMLLNSDSAPAEGATKPKYTLIYREHVDLQDFSCSRDSTRRSPRPKEVVMVVDLPLLGSVEELDLGVTGTSVLLRSRKPGYRLEVPLGYTVDCDKAEAKFNHLTKELTVVLPLKQPASLPSVREETDQPSDPEGGQDHRHPDLAETADAPKPDSQTGEEEDLSSEQTFKQDCDGKPFAPPLAELRETREDGQEVVIRDPAPSAGFSFNSSLYDLD